MTKRISTEVDPYSNHILENSYPFYEELRNTGSAVWIPKRKLWAISRYDDVKAALAASDTLLSGHGVAASGLTNHLTIPHTLSSDGEEHKRRKSIVIAPILPAPLKDLKPRLEQKADKLIDRLLKQDSIDVVQDFSSHLPIEVVADLVGLSNYGRQNMLKWAAASFNALGPINMRYLSTARSFLQMKKFIKTVTRKDLTEDGWASKLFDAADIGQITHEEARSMVLDYVAPSLDTTILSTTEMVHRLSITPGAFDTIKENPALIPGVVTESVRMATPVRGFTRYASEDYQVGDSIIPKGERALVLFASANRDERHYSRPNEFDVHRNPTDQVGWGYGQHSCVGKHLARLEMEILLKTLVEKVGEIETGKPQLLMNNVLQGISHLPATLSASSQTNTNITLAYQPEENRITPAEPQASGKPFKRWRCLVCELIYDESKGWPEDNIAPGTRWEDVPDDWLCPDCGVGKKDFVLISEQSEAPQNTNESIESQIDHSLDPLVIIGTGLAGYNLALEYRQLNKTSPLVLITSDDGSFYSKPALSTGFSKNRSATSLVTHDAEHMASKLDARIFIYSSVSKIDPESSTVHFEGTSIKYDQLVIASGARPVQPPIPGITSSFVHSVNNLMDYQRFRTAAIGLKRVVIIGAGLIGSEYANDLVLSGFQVTVIDPLTSPMANLLPAAASQAVMQSLAEKGVDYRMEECAVEKISSKGLGCEVTLNNGETIEADLVLSAVGVQPNLALANLAGVNTNKGIVTDAFLQTSVKNIYALGDCAEVDGQLLYYIAPLMAGARALAKTLTNTPTQVHYPTMPIVIKTSVCPVVVVPPSAGQNGKWVIEHEDDRSVKAMCYDDDSLIGFALTGNATQHKDNLAKQVNA